jgi:hypothetical protein
MINFEKLQQEHWADIQQEEEEHVSFMCSAMGCKIETYEDYLDMVRDIDTDHYTETHFNLGFFYGLEVARREQEQQRGDTRLLYTVYDIAEVKALFETLEEADDYIQEVYKSDGNPWHVHIYVSEVKNTYIQEGKWQIAEDTHIRDIQCAQ